MPFFFRGLTPSWATPTVPFHPPPPSPFVPDPTAGGQFVPPISTKPPPGVGDAPSRFQAPAIRPAPFRPAPYRPATGLPPGIEEWMPGAGEIDPNPVPWRPNSPGRYIPDPSAPGAPLPPRPRWAPGFRGDGPEYPQIGPLPDGIIRRPLSLYPTYPGTLIPQISIGPDDWPEKKPETDPRTMPRNPKLPDPNKDVPENHPCRQYQQVLLAQIDRVQRGADGYLQAANAMKQDAEWAFRLPMSPECRNELAGLLREIEIARRAAERHALNVAWLGHNVENMNCTGLTDNSGRETDAARNKHETLRQMREMNENLARTLWDLNQRLQDLLDRCLRHLRGGGGGIGMD